MTEAKRKANKLSALGVEKAKKVGRYSDGLGLYLFIVRPGEKVWTFRYTRGGRAREMSLGPLHSVSLAEARIRAREARQLLLDGKDPIECRRAGAAVEKIKQLKTMTFRAAALQFLATDKVEQFKNDKHRAQWRSTLETYAFPVIGDLPLQSIDSAIVLKALLPVWKRTPETGSRLRGRIERVIEWAKPLGLFTGENPASRDALKDHLPAKAKAKHHAAMPYAQVPEFMEKLGISAATSAKCLEFTILCCTRTQETIGARWDEIDLDAAVWTIPAARMKAKRDHRVPLSDRAVELLRGLDRNRPQSGLKSATHVFTNGGGKPLSNMAMLELLRGMAGNGYTVHGFRSSFSDWANERTNYPETLIDMCLAHALKNKTEAAYRRGDALDKRRRLMAEWARYCCNVPGNITADNVTALRA